MRQRLKNAHPSLKKDLDGNILAVFPREKPGMFIFSNCTQFIETVPVLSRDEKNMDDVNTEAEDHIADETRYLIRSLAQIGSSGAVTGQH